MPPVASCRWTGLQVQQQMAPYRSQVRLATSWRSDLVEACRSRWANILFYLFLALHIAAEKGNPVNLDPNK
jgi:hypothetical protein